MSHRSLILSASLAVLLGVGALVAADTMPAVKADPKPDAAKAEAPKAPVPVVDAAKAPAVESTGRRDRGDRSDRGDKNSRQTSAPASGRSASSGPAPITADTFRLIGDRNIFNPNRSPRTRGDRSEDQPRGETISFVGTMEYTKGRYAFFDGSDRSYQKTLTEGGKIGPFTVKNITADSVELIREPGPFSLKMGQQLRKPVGGDWNAVSAEVARADAARAAEAAAASAFNPSAPVVIPENVSDAVRKMMERRNQTLKQ